jgi:hypothetical protein
VWKPTPTFQPKRRRIQPHHHCDRPHRCLEPNGGKYSLTTACTTQDKRAGLNTDVSSETPVYMTQRQHERPAPDVSNPTRVRTAQRQHGRPNANVQDATPMFQHAGVYNPTPQFQAERHVERHANVSRHKGMARFWSRARCSGVFFKIFISIYVPTQNQGGNSPPWWAIYLFNAMYVRPK